jgi:alkanesulfonate monooxygenase SsuD/methylene tetrahydromethanopterin reductase-like flavin-dependent oxidoreductase (luciferase family)
VRLGVLATIGKDWKEGLERVRIAEDLGYEHVATGEAWGPSVLPFLTLIAAKTSRITIGTSIVNCFSRSPAVLAQEFAMLDQISEGRAVLGLGSSGANVIEHLHGVRFAAPLRRIRETVEIFDLLIAGERLDYAGEIFQLHRGFQLEYARPRTKIPVWIAAISPSSINQTGVIADGVIPIHWPKQKFASLRAELQVAAEVAGKPNKLFTIAPFTTVNVLDGKNDDAKWQEARQILWFYINKMGVFYWQMLERNGYEAEVASSRKAFAERDSKGALDAISERMIRDLQCIGRIDEVREQLRERAALGADLQMIYMPRGDIPSTAEQLEELIA